MFPLPKSTCKLDLACLTCPLRLHLRWIRAEGCFSFLVSFPFSFAGNLLDFSSTPLLCLTSLWVKFPLSLLHLMQWTTALSLLVCRSSYYKRWGTTSIRSSMSPFLATITCFIVLILCLIASRFVLASPLVVLYPICRQYCDPDSCRYYRSITFYILVFFFIFVIWRAIYRKEKENSQAIRVTGTQQQEEQAENV